MKKLLLFSLLAGFSAFGQPVYKSAEVDQAADPTGGAVVLNQFIAANLQIPISSAAQGLSGGTVVKGIVAPDGTMSRLEVVRSLDSLCDREAMRVLGLYKAWQPALRNGVAVHQEVTYPVFFRTARLSTFDFATHTLIEYFDKNYHPTSDPDQYEYRRLIPVDGRGSVRAEVVYEQNWKGTWKRVMTLPFQEKEEWVRLPADLRPDSVRAIRRKTQELDIESGAQTVTVQDDGKLLSIVALVGSGRLPYMSKYYYKSGLLREEMNMVDSIKFVTSWHDNGQLHATLEENHKKGTFVRSVFDRTGNQLVKEGNGWAILAGTPINFRNVYEQGQVVEARKSGRWTGRYADSTLVYEELYEGGVLKKGIAFRDEKQIEYHNEFTTEAQFPGKDGKMDMYRFMGKTIRYPIEAARNNITGKVVVAFLIHEDGSSSDFQIEQSADRRLDGEALRVAKLMSGKWQPAMLKGRPVEVRFSLPIGFNVESSGVVVHTMGGIR